MNEWPNVVRMLGGDKDKDKDKDPDPVGVDGDNRWIR
jgi:hypothetical protein